MNHDVAAHFTKQENIQSFYTSVQKTFRCVSHMKLWQLSSLEKEESMETYTMHNVFLIQQE